MPMQLTLDFTRKAQSQDQPIIKNETWLDVSDIAQGTGFTTLVHMSLALHDALQPSQDETDSDYDQRLYDCLWLACFKLSLDQRQTTTFNFTATRRYRETLQLRLKVEMQEQTARVGLLQDF